jgi:SpoVK/Ycf46/Vps4 family AAA+-type ATPase
LNAKPYQQEHSLSLPEQAIADLVRVGLSGDVGSVRQLARRMLRRQAAETFSADLRQQLGSLMVGQGNAVLRGARPPMPVDSDGQLALATVDDEPFDEPPVLDPSSEAVLAALIDQRRQAERLALTGLEAPKSLLLQGPPGVGKTLTARFLAHELGLPLMTVELAALMSSLLGQTGQNLRQLLDHARSFPCVLLLDEFDAVAKRRDDQSDIGELKRLVNVLLLELERWPDTGLLVAATNHPQLLDPAVGRRFDLTLALNLPGQAERVAIMARALKRFGLEVGADVIAASALALDGGSGADIERDVAAAARRAALSDAEPATVLADIALVGLRDGKDADRRAAFCAMATKHLGLSQRAVGDLLEISHPTVGKLARRWTNAVATVSTGATG